MHGALHPDVFFLCILIYIFIVLSFIRLFMFILFWIVWAMLFWILQRLWVLGCLGTFNVLNKKLSESTCIIYSGWEVVDEDLWWRIVTDLAADIKLDICTNHVYKPVSVKGSSRYRKYLLMHTDQTSLVRPASQTCPDNIPQNYFNSDAIIWMVTRW